MAENGENQAPRLFRLRAFECGDKPACLSIFASNIPKYFTKHELGEFCRFLEELPCPYFVLENHSGKIIGCGGYGADDGRLAWGMIDKRHHGEGAGRFLLQERLRLWFAENGPGIVGLCTCQHTYGFFAKQGFVTKKIIENGISDGLHQYDMELSLHENWFSRSRPSAL